MADDRHPEARELDWSCHDCKCDTYNEYYMIQDSLWERYGCDDGLLCIGCLEGRLGRELASADFTHWMINVWNYGDKSDRLIERLLRV